VKPAEFKSNWPSYGKSNLEVIMDDLISALAFEIATRVTVALVSSIEPFDTWFEQLGLLIHGSI
jgi:hypothetical protein